MPAPEPIHPGGPSAHTDTFAADNLPPPELWPHIDFGVLPKLAAYPNRINAAQALLDSHIDAGHGDRALMHFADTVWTYADMKDRADRIAHVLVEDLGLVPGNRVLLRGPNNPMMAACWLAVIKAGGICVATMPLLRARELAFVIDKAQVTHALCDASLADELTAARQRSAGLDTLVHFTALGESAEAELDRMSASKPTGFTNVDTAADDVALIAFTSGTTGKPKGAVHFHRDVLAMCDTFADHVSVTGPDDIFTGTPPLAFTFGLGALLAFPMRSGSSVAFVERPAPDKLLETIQAQRCSVLYTTPIMFRAILDRLSDYDISSLKQCVSAGEHLPKATFEAWHEATGLKIIDGLGATEMIHIFVSSSGDDTRAGATGKAIPGYQACIMDDDGNILPPGTVGNLAVRGPTGCRYLDNRERQETYVRDGWNLPGDMYLMDEDGYFWYQSRADDMIISAGYNIAGAEIENVLLEHDAVRDCAVIGAPDRQRGNIVKAFVVLHDAAPPTPELVKNLQDFVKSEIAPYKYPRAVEFIDALPRTETGKVQRFRLREQELQKAATQ